MSGHAGLPPAPVPDIEPDFSYLRTNESDYLEPVKAKLEAAGKHLKALST
jgi:hypothetical protein